MMVSFTLNGRSQSVDVEPATLVADLLRETLNLTGTHIGCDTSQCGACTVLFNGEAVKSCTMLVPMLDGGALTTIEGLSEPGRNLHPVQAAFLARDAFQCGYCTPGQIMSAVACIREGHARSDDEIREYMSGNLCRCGAYPHIVAAVRQAAETTP